MHASTQACSLADSQKTLIFYFEFTKKLILFCLLTPRFFILKFISFAELFLRGGGANLVKRTGTNERTRERRGVKNWKFRAKLLFGWRPSKNCILFSIGTLNVQHSRAKFVFEKIKFQVLHLFANSQGSLKIRLAFQNCY